MAKSKKAKKPTVDEHYVPQVYLRSFSPDGSRVYRFDLKSCTTKNILIKTGSVAFKKNLYEVRNPEGKIVFTNYIEDKLCKIEGIFRRYRDNLVAQILCGNRNTKPFLSDDMVTFFTIYTAIQLLRNPFTIHATQSELLRLSEHNLSDNAAYAQILNSCFPFFKDSSPEITAFYREMIGYLVNMEVFVGYCSGSQILTSDNPAIAISYPITTIGFQALYFPLSSNVVLIFINKRRLEKGIGNTLFQMGEHEIKHINDNIIFNAFHEIYSQNPFSEEQIDHILAIQNSHQKKQLISKRGAYNYKAE